MPEQSTSVNQMDLFNIYVHADAKEHLCTTMADSPEEALDFVRGNDWVRGQLSDGAWAEMAEEVGEW